MSKTPFAVLCLLTSPAWPAFWYILPFPGLQIAQRCLFQNSDWTLLNPKHGMYVRSNEFHCHFVFANMVRSSDVKCLVITSCLTLNSVREPTEKKEELAIGWSLLSDFAINLHNSIAEHQSLHNSMYSSCHMRSSPTNPGSGMHVTDALALKPRTWSSAGCPVARPHTTDSSQFKKPFPSLVVGALDSLSCTPSTYIYIYTRNNSRAKPCPNSGRHPASIDRLQMEWPNPCVLPTLKRTSQACQSAWSPTLCLRRFHRNFLRLALAPCLIATSCHEPWFCVNCNISIFPSRLLRVRHVWHVGVPANVCHRPIVDRVGGGWAGGCYGGHFARFRKIQPPYGRPLC